ncbi:MAG TPA: sporulation transcription factor Spo0A [Clostridiales bacterium]|nr:sporulation transcription factor Spo0A [Clostridiales bacterium]
MKMKTANIAIFERNEEFMQKLKSYFDEASGFTVCAAATTGDEALERLKVTSPDVAVIDTALKGIDGIKLLDYIKSIRPECMSFMISEFDNDKIVNSAISHGAIYYFVKPVSPSVIGERINDVLKDRTYDYKVSSELRDKRRTSSLDEKISNIFTTIGIPPHIKGYVYLREGIKMAVEDPSIINKVTKELYPKIGEKFTTTSSKVERAIRHAIEVAWNRGRTDAISSVFGARVYIGNERPTNSEFIALVADKLILENFI